MPRRARLTLDGVPLHITQAAAYKQPCFFCRNDYRYYLQLLAELAPRFECAIHAYALMGNHVHLLLTPEDKNAPAKLMKNIAQLYTNHINRTQEREGRLWGGRFRSCLVEDEDFIIDLYRFIESNPLRCGLVENSVDYPWTSHAANAYQPSPVGYFLTPHQRFEMLGSDPDHSRRVYRRMFEQALPQPVINAIRRATVGNRTLAEHPCKLPGLKPSHRIEEQRAAGIYRGRSESVSQKAVSLTAGLC